MWRQGIALIAICLRAALAVAQVDSDYERVLKSYIEEDHLGPDKTKRDEYVTNWPGIRTMDGVRAMIAELLKPTGGDRRSRTFEILARSEVPHEQIVSYLLERAQGERDNQDMIWRYFALFTRYPEDDRILKFLAPLLDNRIVPDPKRKRGQDDQGDPWRICDAVHGTIIQILEKRGEIKPGDSGYGDPGGENAIENRERNIGLLKEKLKESGYLEVGGIEDTPGFASSVGRSASTTGSSAAVSASNNGHFGDSPAAHRSDAGRKQERVNWFAWLAAAIILAAATLFALGRRKA